MLTRLMCDFDGALPDDFAQRLVVVVAAHRLRVECVSYRKTRRGWHVVVTVRQRVAFWRVVLLQALLGSDWKRETFNSRRATAWRRVPPFWRSRANVLYLRHHRSVSL